MFVFYAAAAFVAVLFVFDSPAVDYRVVMAGGVLPLAEAVTGRPLMLHTLLGSVVLLALVMLATIGRRLTRRRWLGLPIGTFVFLVASGVWTRAELFWWPLLGLDGIGEPPLPEFDRPAALLVVLEVVGVATLAYLFHRFEMRNPQHRRQFVATGRVPRQLLR